MWKAGLDEEQAWMKTARRNINNLRYADDTTLMAESEEELDSLDKSKREEWNSWLKTQHLKNFKIMASSPITSWQIDGETMETVTDLNHCWRGQQQWKWKTLAPWKKSYDKPR